MGFLETFITSIISSGLLVWVFKDWLSTRLKASIQHEYDRKLESIKAELSRDAAFHAAAHSSFAAGQKAAMERKLNAADILWRKLVEFRDQLPPVLSFADILTVQEYKDAQIHGRFGVLTQDIDLKKITSLSPLGIEEVRPYVGEYIWHLFFTYQAVFLRIVFMFTEGMKDKEKFEWFKNDSTRQLLRNTLTNGEMEAFDKVNFGKIRWLQQRLEGKILNELHKIISGEDTVPKSIEQISLIQQLLTKVEAENKGLAPR